MKKLNGKKILRIAGIVCLIYIGCLFITYIISKNADPSTFLHHETISFEEGVYRYDPQVILPKIRNGEEDVFFETEPDTDLYLPESDNINNLFSDEELFEITRTFFESKWDDNFEDWRLVEISYGLYNCKEGFQGPYSVDYYFQKKIRKNYKIYINERNVGFAVWKDMIGWSDKVVDNTRLRAAINFDAINIHAMDIYDISEENGGAETHSGSENNCANVVIYIVNNDDGWNVDYYNQSGNGLLDLKIDSYSGKVKK